MARSIDFWYTTIINEKNNQVTIKDALAPDSNTVENIQLQLAELSSNSKVAIWRLLCFIVAVAYWILDNYWDLTKKDLQYIADSGEYGTDNWWLDVAKRFQFGDDLVVLTNSSGSAYVNYATIKDASDASRVIKLASISRTNGTAFLKVANLTGSTIVPLTNDQLNAFKTYVNRRQPSGASIIATSDSPDLVRFQLVIYYNGLIDLANFKTNIETGISDYLAQINADLKGTLDLVKLQDVIQSVTGFISMEPIIAFAKSYNSDYNQFTRNYETFAGYAVIDSQYPLDGNDPNGTPVITYIAS